MNSHADIIEMAILANDVLNAIERLKIKDKNAVEVLANIASSLDDGYSDWASELIYEAKELTKDGRER